MSWNRSPSFWDTHDVPPATQYLVAYVRYPLAVQVGGPFVQPCAGAVTRVPVHAEPVTLLPTAGTFHYRWSSPDPGVSFVDETAADTEALVAGAGVFPVTVSAFIGAFEASATTTVEVPDVTPPRFVQLGASPDTLWPPNHRHVVVSVEALVEDDCDPAPSLRLVRAVSNEPDDTRGDGRTMGDITGASIPREPACVAGRHG